MRADSGACDTKDSDRSNGGIRLLVPDEHAGELLRKYRRVLPDCAPELWQRVKSNASRTVYRGNIDGQKVFLKHFHSKSRKRQALRLLGLNDATQEARICGYLGDKSIPTPKVIAAWRHQGSEWLATVEISDAMQADKWHAQQLEKGKEGAGAIRRATVRLAQIIAGMHIAGVIHSDLHSGNILAPIHAQGGELILMDLHRVKRRRHLSRRARAANLAQLLYDRLDCTSRTDRLRFLKEYLRYSDDHQSLRGWLFYIERFVLAHAARQYSQRDRRLAGGNNYFARLSLHKGYKGICILASKKRLAGSRAAKLVFTAQQWREAIGDVEALLSGPDVEVIKDSPSSLVVRRRLRLGPHQVDVFIKRTRRKRRLKKASDVSGNQ